MTRCQHDLARPRGKEGREDQCCLSQTRSPEQFDGHRDPLCDRQSRQSQSQPSPQVPQDSPTSQHLDWTSHIPYHRGCSPQKADQLSIKTHPSTCLDRLSDQQPSQPVSNPPYRVNHTQTTHRTRPLDELPHLRSAAYSEQNLTNLCRLTAN